MVQTGLIDPDVPNYDLNVLYPQHIWEVSVNPCRFSEPFVLKTSAPFGLFVRFSQSADAAWSADYKSHLNAHAYLLTGCFGDADHVMRLLQEAL